MKLFFALTTLAAMAVVVASSSADHDEQAAAGVDRGPRGATKEKKDVPIARALKGMTGGGEGGMMGGGGGMMGGGRGRDF